MAGAMPEGHDDYRSESDYNTIQRACEVMCDKIRMRGVLRHSAKVKAADAKMSTLLTKFRTGKMKY